MDLGNISLTFIIIDRHLFTEKLARILEKLEKSDQEVIYSSKCFNCIYMKFVGYDTCDKIIWTSGEVWINTDTISKQGIPKININKTSPSSTLGFGCSPHKETCYILSEDLVSCRLWAYSSKTMGVYWGI